MGTLVAETHLTSYDIENYTLAHVTEKYGDG